MVIRRRLLPLLLGASCLMPWPAFAQAASLTPAPPLSGAGGVSGAGGSLAQALGQAELPKDDVYLSVDAETVALPKDAAPPQAGQPIFQVADAYGRITQTFETVTAVAPPTMTVLNTNPGVPNPFDGMPPGDAFALLLAGLSDGQWKLLTGQAGLGYSDLTDARQQELFDALFPGGKITATPKQAPGVPYDPHGVITLNGSDLSQAKLHLTQRIGFDLPMAGRPGGSIGGGEVPSADGRPRYDGNGIPLGSGNGMLYGVEVMATLPNALKDSDLDFSADMLAKPVSLAGVKTVGDLVARIGQTVKLELYTDPRYEKGTVTLLGPKSARAKDLLRALALCVCGAYRKVGPAYVLTNDRIGLGTRRQILSRFSQEADIARAAALSGVGDKLILAHGGVDALTADNPALAFSDAEKAQAARFQMPGTGIRLNVPLSELTPEQQDMARRMVVQANAFLSSHSPDGAIVRASLEGNFQVSSSSSVTLTSPLVPGPVDVGSLGAFIFQPSPQLQQQWLDKRIALERTAPPPPQPAIPPAPPLAPLLARMPRRALLAAPRTAQEVDTLVASMKVIGLNQLWLDVFSEGRSHLVPPSDGGPDILTEALKQTRGTGIAVIPTLNLLDWATDTPEAAWDRTQLGETSAQSETFQKRYNALTNGQTPEEVAQQPPPRLLSASPAAPLVQRTLTALVARLAATPGVAALALQGTLTTGYGNDPMPFPNLPENEMGYTAPLRLTLLRAAHVDPVDLSDTPYIGNMGREADTSVPEFQGAALEDAYARWYDMRRQANEALMRRLLGTAQRASGRRMGLLVQERTRFGGGEWWGLWDNPRAPLPGLNRQGMVLPLLNADLPAYAHTQCRVNVSVLPSFASSSADALASVLQQTAPGWDGFVVDVTNAFPGDDNPLAHLAKDVAQPAGVKK